MARQKRLPKGLAEFEASLDDPDYGLKLLPRLLDLPENGLDGHIRMYQDAVSSIRKAEELLSNLRHKASRIAQETFDIARKNWSIKEIQKATGYEDE